MNLSRISESTDVKPTTWSSAPHTCGRFVSLESKLWAWTKNFWGDKGWWKEGHGVNIQNLQLPIPKGLQASHLKIHTQFCTLQHSSVFQRHLSFAAPLQQPESEEEYHPYTGYGYGFLQRHIESLMQNQKAAYLMTTFQSWVPQNCTQDISLWNTELLAYEVGAAHVFMHFPHDLDSVCPTSRWETEVNRG